MSVIQIFGTNGCPFTRKAKRFFMERGIGFQFIDLKKKEISAGELRSVCSMHDPMDLINVDSPAYKNGGFAYMEYDPVREILEDNALLKTPVVRYGSRSTVGPADEIWKEWLK